MNAIIHEVARMGISQGVYDAICAMAFVISLCYSLWHGRKIGVPLWKMGILLLVVYYGMVAIQGGIWDVLLYIRSNHILGIETAVNSVVRVFVFLPLMGFILAKIFRLPWSHVCDAIAMFPLLMSGISQLACIFAGCCVGYPWQWGVYSVQTGSHHVPVPILETVLTLVIFFCLIYQIKRNGYQSDGTHYPLVMVWYGIMRFVCEALRDNEKIFLGCSAVAIHAAFLCAAGVVWLWCIRRVRSRQSTEEQPLSPLNGVSSLKGRARHAFPFGKGGKNL